ncbi:SDR family NAD(P)-dependent oxidoreductase [Octadecabacter sp. SW4]|uniref:SDR family NAD(P)-dependent oxidoreductase n=1 Tax=Octadecabacter sp. SW4 TaxID=2602067 RepID=UPI0011C1F5DB|nr:SDR family NAD(P)-dependent oxidoreductase [Octadecabacter sp. SW4]QEE35120.1 SDR family NAD(P)-dependent oxidoreductase [Octadecabacter sp. SW4]
MKILITGAGTGLGRLTAIELAERGHDILAGVISTTQAASFEKLNRITPIKLDITNADDRAQAAEFAADVLVNNAGVSQLGPLALMPMDRARQVFEVNVFGTLAMTQACVPAMTARGSGRILFVSSIAGVSAGAMAGPYAMSKHAMQAMGASLREELAPQGIDVVLANPGPHATGFNDRMFDSLDEWLTGAAEETYRPFVQALSNAVTVGQLDPADAASQLADLCEAETTELINPIPPSLF